MTTTEDQTALLAVLKRSFQVLTRLYERAPASDDIHRHADRFAKQILREVALALTTGSVDIRLAREQLYGAGLAIDYLYFRQPKSFHAVDHEGDDAGGEE